MKYYIISTSKSGHGAIFTNQNEAKEYQAKHAGSVFQMSDRLPEKIPPMQGKTDPKPLEAISGRIDVYTDGSAIGNPGPGGYGIVIKDKKKTRAFSQGYEYTTNNRMEMMAVIKALEILEENAEADITIYSDSQYTLNGITKGWAKGWKKRGWKKSDGNPALNIDLWKKILDLLEKFSALSFQWVKGHAGNPLNERADDLANSAAQGDDLIIDEGYRK